MKVYKFRSLNSECHFDRVMHIIEKGKLWSSKASSLNDIFELKPQFNLQICKRTLPAYIDILKSIGSCNEDMEKEIRSRFSHGEMRSGTGTVMRNYIALLNKVGICSLSKNHSSPLLWGIYADNCKGVALEFDIPDINHSSNFFSVNYSNIRPKLSLTDINSSRNNELISEKIFKSIFGTKSKHWKFEQEVRCITSEGDLEIDHAGMVTKIIFGPKCSESNIEKICRTFPDIEACTTSISDISYDIEIQDSDPFRQLHAFI